MWIRLLPVDVGLKTDLFTQSSPLQYLQVVIYLLLAFQILFDFKNCAVK